MFGLVSALTLNPSQAEAFWPFTSSADAAVNALIPSSSTSALSATMVIDPEASVDRPLATTGDMALIAFSGPSGTIADLPEEPQSDRISVYVVRTGDTLSDIAAMYNVSVNTIIWANNLKGIKDVHVGQTLVILPVSGVKRTVVAGDTLASLAKKYDGDEVEIAQFNGLNAGDSLAVGSTIIIPGGEAAAPATTNKPRTVARGSIGPEPYLDGSGPAIPGYYRNPVPGARLTQGLHGHNGVDFGGARGTAIHAAAAGTVIIARNSGWNGGYGNYVVISHANGTQTLYAHLINATVAPGQSVTAGQTIGYMGSTGKSTGNHLHFEVRGAKNPFAR